MIKATAMYKHEQQQAIIIKINTKNMKKKQINI